MVTALGAAPAPVLNLDAPTISIRFSAENISGDRDRAKGQRQHGELGDDQR